MVTGRSRYKRVFLKLSDQPKTAPLALEAVLRSKDPVPELCRGQEGVAVKSAAKEPRTAAGGGQEDLHTLRYQERAELGG